MTHRRKLQYHEVTYSDLMSAAHSSPSAMDVLREYQRTSELTGRVPHILCSEFNGYRICETAELIRYFP
jgi:hypothetical protein